MSPRVSTLGYDTFVSIGNHSNRATGGTLVTARKELAAKLLDAHRHDDYQWTIVKIQSWHIINIYVPPRSETLQQAQLALTDTLRALTR